MADYDLTHRLSKFLDRHLVFPLLEFLSARGTYDPKSIQVRRKCNILQPATRVLTPSSPHARVPRRERVTPRPRLPPISPASGETISLRGASAEWRQGPRTAATNLSLLSPTSIHPQKSLPPKIPPPSQLAKIELLSKTNMVDYALDIFKSVHGTEEPPADMAARRADVIARLGALQAAAAPVVAFLQDEAAVRALGQDKAANLAHLQAAHGIGAPHIAALYHYAKFQFECGNYGAAAEFLHHYRALGTDGGRVLAAMWGSLACEVLLQRWDAALASVTRLREVIDADAFAPPALALQRRAWLAHWALFVFFNADGGRAALVDLLLSDRYAAALQLLAPHLLRYLCVAAVVTKRRRATLKDVVRLVDQEAYQYEDAVTSFLRCLLSQHDFEGAQARLAECGPLLAGDFFVASLASEFVEAARLLVFEAYCRVHQRIDLGLLADRLGLDQAAAEAWVVGLVRGARLDARLDAAAGAVVLGAPFPSARAALVETVKGLAQRTVTLANAVTGAGAAAR